MRNFLNAIKGFPHPEERPEGASRSTHDHHAANFFNWLAGWDPANSARFVVMI
jgi:hypothetical protein